MTVSDQPHNDPCQFVRDPGRAQSAGGGDQGRDGGGGAALLGRAGWEHVSRGSLDNKMHLPVFTLTEVTLGICSYIRLISILNVLEKYFAFLN